MLTIVKKKKKAEANLAKYNVVLLFSPLKVHSPSEKDHSQMKFHVKF